MMSQLQQNLGNISDDPMPCSKCLSPFRNNVDIEFGLMSESLEDTRSIGSGFLDKKWFKEENLSSPTSSNEEEFLPLQIHPTLRRIDILSRVLFPSLYLFFVVLYFCKYLA